MDAALVLEPGGPDQIREPIIFRGGPGNQIACLPLRLPLTQAGTTVTLQSPPSLPQTDSPGAAFLSGDERSEQFFPKLVFTASIFTPYLAFHVSNLLGVVGHYSTVNGDPFISRPYLHTA
jgi:hypothetical protein